MAKYVVGCTIDDIPHITDARKKEYIASIPEHQRSARLRGEPSIGSGAVYPIDEAELLVRPFEIPPYWRRVFALDVGQHTAVLWAAIDPNSGCMYIYDEYECHMKEPPMIVHMIKAKGSWIPGVVDPSALQGSKRGDGMSLYKEYSKLGLKLTTKVDNGIESGILRNLNMIYAGKMKIFTTCTKLRDELRVYSRDATGKVGRNQKDHLLDDWRYISGTGYKIARSLNEIEKENDKLDDNYHIYDTRNKTTGY